VPDFDYRAKAEAKLEVPLAERIAQIRAKKAEDRERAKAKAARRDAAQAGGQARQSTRPPEGAGRRGPQGRDGRPGNGGRPRGRPGSSGRGGGRA
jgi:ATP-dependent RNA helicase RhlE